MSHESFDIRKIDKSNFEALKFTDGSVYYGECKWFDMEDNPVEEPTEEAVEADPNLLNNLKKLRHGFGIQIFFRLDGTILCKYEGEWKKG